ncbi:MAG TPA: cytochrome c [Acidimicrobiia bacterium]|nr:cytochrome c [Acidimicrobiia bacterium]
MNRVTVTAVAALLLAGCVVGSEIGIEPQDPELVEAGAELYAANCAECHGSDLRGTDKGPSHLSIIYEPRHHADGAFVFAIQRGSRAHHWPFGDMPPIEGLNADEIEAIIAFVREQQRVEGFEPS